MIGLLQRVSRASVSIGGETVATIGRGLLVLVAVEQGDAPAQAERLAERLLSYRVFEDDRGRMNLDVVKIEGDLLLVPQFTLAANTRKGNRPGFSRAAPPQSSKALFARLVGAVKKRYPRIAAGRFGADMDVTLTNQGPVTFWLQVPPDG